MMVSLMMMVIYSIGCGNGGDKECWVISSAGGIE